jgi:hypothetical protein
VAWPAKVLGSLVSAVEVIDVSLDQMQPGSEFLASLTSSADPGIPYVIIAGNTSIIPAALVAGEPQSRLAHLWERITRANWRHTGANLAFFNQPNDIAVSVQSIRSVPARMPEVIKVETPCDHLSYFSTTEGLQALADAVAVGTVSGS